MTTLDLSVLERYADVRKRRLDTEHSATDLKDEEATLLALALDAMAEANVTKAVDPKGRNLAIRHDLFVSAKLFDPDGDPKGPRDEEAVNAVLDELGLEELVKRSANKRTLASYVREQESNETPIDPRLIAVLNINRVPKIGVTGG